MNLLRSTSMLGVCLALAAPATADVTVIQKVNGKAMGAAMSGESTQYIKGTQMRTDQKVGRDDTSTIIDAASGRMMSLNHSKREAEIYDMAQMSQELAKISAADIEASLTPTAQTRQIAGATCTVHEMQMRVPMMAGAAGMTVMMSGPVCIAKDAPGAADYAAFYRAAADNGLFFGDPRAAKAQPGQTKGMTQLYREMADRGVPYAMEMNVKIEGSGPMAGIMARMGGSSMTSEVLSISTDPIPDSLFEVPTGYKVRNR
jgi:hypothetical protein